MSEAAAQIALFVLKMISRADSPGHHMSYIVGGGHQWIRAGLPVYWRRFPSRSLAALRCKGDFSRSAVSLSLSRVPCSSTHAAAGSTSAPCRRAPRLETPSPTGWRWR
jgi:hypothetical protein